MPSGMREVAAIRWGDLVTAHRSTGIANITTYTGLPMGGRLAGVSGVLGWGPVRALAARIVRARVTGPSAATRAITRCEVWGEVRDADGGQATGTLTGPNAYDLTADSVVRAAALLLAGDIPPGAHTPSSALGASYVESLTNVRLTMHQ